MSAAMANTGSSIEKITTEGSYEALYQQVREMEKENKDILLQFREEYPGVTNSDNVQDILAAIREKQHRSS